MSDCSLHYFSSHGFLLNLQHCDLKDKLPPNQKVYTLPLTCRTIYLFGFVLVRVLDICPLVNIMQLDACGGQHGKTLLRAVSCRNYFLSALTTTYHCTDDDDDICSWTRGLCFQWGGMRTSCTSSRCKTIQSGIFPSYLCRCRLCPGIHRHKSDSCQGRLRCSRNTHCHRLGNTKTTWYWFTVT